MSPVQSTIDLEQLLSRHNLQLRTDSKKFDERTVQELMFASFAAHGLSQLSQWYTLDPRAFTREYFGANEHKRVARIIQTLSEEVIGCGFLIQHCGKKPELGEISKVYLKEPYQGLGIGEALVVDLIGQAQKFGFTSIYLSSRVEFVKALQLYEKLGFTRIPHPYYSSKNSIAMQLDLSK